MGEQDDQPPGEERGSAGLAPRLALALPLAWLAWILWDPVSGGGLWGPEGPWSNLDFVGNFWCWWAEGERLAGGSKPAALLTWPWGEQGLSLAFPNRIDALLAVFQAGGRLDPDAFVDLWRQQAMIHIALLCVATMAACRLAGAGPVATATAAMLVVASPTTLHELGGGRMATFIMWPGVLAMGLAAWGGRAQRGGPALVATVLAGAMLGIQFLAYPYHALAAGLAAGPLLMAGAGALPRAHRAGALSLGLVPLAPWCLDLFQAGAELTASAPPAGYTALPGAGLLGITSVPERFRLLPGAAPLVVCALFSRRGRVAAACALGLLVLALGPAPSWGLGPGGAHGGWFQLIPLMDRMHHPVRVAPFAMAAGAMGLALLLSRDPGAERATLPRLLAGGAVWLVVSLSGSASGRVTTWGGPPAPPGVAAARWLEAEGRGPVVHLTTSAAPLGMVLQPWHRRPLAEGIVGYQPSAIPAGTPRPPPGEEPWAGIWALANDLSRCRPLDPAELAIMEKEGFEHVLLVHGGDPGPWGCLEGLLGPPAWQDQEAIVFRCCPPRSEAGPPSG